MSLKIILILVAIILIELLALIITFKILKGIKKDKKSLEDELKKQKENTLFLYKYAEEIALIEKEKSKVSKKIKECKTDEEALNIINSIIKLNNSKLQDNSKE